MHVAEILKSKGHGVVTVDESVTVAEVCRILKQNRIGAVVVTHSDGTHSGILSERDIVYGLVTHGAGLLDMTAAQVMTRDVPTCSPESRVEELMEQMTNCRVRHLPVINRGALEGIVSIGDVVKWRLDELQAEAQNMRDYFTGRW